MKRLLLAAALALACTSTSFAHGDRSDPNYHDGRTYWGHEAYCFGLFWTDQAQMAIDCPNDPVAGPNYTSSGRTAPVIVPVPVVEPEPEPEPEPVVEPEKDDDKQCRDKRHDDDDD